VLRRKFPQPEQSANGISDKELMRELDRKESDERMQMDTEHLHKKYIMTVINVGGSHLFNMPFNALGKTLHKAGDGLNEFDLIIKHSGSVTDLDDAIHEQFSHDMKLQFNDCSFQSLIPGKDIEDNVCDLCINC
jgi:hypothetical protein